MAWKEACIGGRGDGSGLASVIMSCVMALPKAFQLLAGAAKGGAGGVRTVYEGAHALSCTTHGSWHSYVAQFIL